MPFKVPHAVRLLLFLAALSGLVTGIFSGLARLGAVIPGATLAGNHGPLMICGLFGTLISLERAVAMNKGWGYLAPFLSALGVVALLAGLPLFVAITLFCAAAFMLTVGSVYLWRRQPVMHLGTLALAAGMWLWGNLLWLIHGYAAPAVLAWQAFLVLTIAGERLELSRFLPTPALARKIFAGLMGVTVLGVVVADAGIFAFAMLGLAVWLLRYDIVRHTIRQPGLPRYIATCLGSGYLWLLLSAALALFGDSDLRDASLHSLLLGFVIAMVFGHAPVVLPAVAKLRLPFHVALYLPLLVLHLSLAIRVLAGLTGDFALRREAALGNGLALTLFAATVVCLLLRRKN